MVDITPLVGAGQQIIQSYGANGFRVSGVAYDGPVLVRPARTLPWAVADIGMLTAQDFGQLQEDEAADILLLGTGMRMALPPAEVRDALRRVSITLEPMDTGAACRTYNVLMAEGRRVAAALFPTA